MVRDLGVFHAFQCCLLRYVNYWSLFLKRPCTVYLIVFISQKNLATSTTTPTTPGIITTYPPPELLYAKTTDYHWPNFEQKMDDRTGKYLAEDGGLSDGPFGFGKSVKLKVGVEGEQDEVCTLVNMKLFFWLV